MPTQTPRDSSPADDRVPVPGNALGLAEPAGASEPSLAVQQRIAEINRCQAEVNATCLRDLDRQRRLLAFQREEAEAQIQLLEGRRQELSGQATQLREAQEQFRAAQQEAAEARAQAGAVLRQNQSLRDGLQAAMEKELFPDALLAPELKAWRGDLLSELSANGASDPYPGLLLATLHLAKAASRASDSEELCRALFYVGRYLYKVCASQKIEEIATLLNAGANGRFNLRLARPGEPTDKTWMSFSGIASVNAVHGWAVLGPDRLRRHAAEVS